jgi:hypothetical protein
MVGISPEFGWSPARPAVQDTHGAEISARQLLFMNTGQASVRRAKLEIPSSVSEIYGRL